MRRKGDSSPASLRAESSHRRVASPILFAGVLCGGLTWILTTPLGSRALRPEAPEPSIQIGDAAPKKAEPAFEPAARLESAPRPRRPDVVDVGYPVVDLGNGRFGLSPSATSAELARFETIHIQVERQVRDSIPIERFTTELTVDEVRQLLRTPPEANRLRALEELERAKSTAFIPLLFETIMAPEPPPNLRGLIDRLAVLKDQRWSARQATGAADTPIEGDFGTAWAPKKAEMGEVTLDLTFRTPVRVEGIRIHETLGPGAVARVQALRADGTWETLWEGTNAPDPAPRWFEPTLSRSPYTANVIRIVVDTDRVPGWNEIDAVELVGNGLRQWAEKASASSSADE